MSQKSSCGNAVPTQFLMWERRSHAFQPHYNDNDNDNEIDLFRHHNGHNTNIKVIFKQVTMLDNCKCI